MGIIHNTIFDFCNGVNQGGVISAIFFYIIVYIIVYIDSLLMSLLMKLKESEFGYHMMELSCEHFSTQVASQLYLRVFVV